MNLKLNTGSRLDHSCGPLRNNSIRTQHEAKKPRELYGSGFRGCEYDPGFSKFQSPSTFWQINRIRPYEAMWYYLHSQTIVWRGDGHGRTPSAQMSRKLNLSMHQAILSTFRDVIPKIGRASEEIEFCTGDVTADLRHKRVPPCRQTSRMPLGIHNQRYDENASRAVGLRFNCFPVKHARNRTCSNRSRQNVL